MPAGTLPAGTSSFSNFPRSDDRLVPTASPTASSTWDPDAGRGTAAGAPKSQLQPTRFAVGDPQRLEPRRFGRQRDLDRCAAGAGSTATEQIDR